MIVINGIFEIAPAAFDALKPALAAMEQASQAEAGCHDYTFSVEVNDPSKVRLTEKWADMDALRAHFQAPHMAEFRAAMAANPPTSAQVSFYEATEFEPPRT